MSRYKVILWDMDGTILDFYAAERVGIKKCFQEFGLGECSDARLERYTAINIKYWEALERGEITKPQVLVGRFQEFFAEEGIDVGLAEEFNAAYQLSLGDTIVFHDQADQIVRDLKGKVMQVMVTNGSKEAQSKKLKTSGLGEVFDYIFISDYVGHEKPTMEFFNHVFAGIPSVDKKDVVIIGDSLTSDIRGGNNAGIDTIWYNVEGLTNDLGVHVDFEITDLHEIYNILEMTNDN